MKWEYKILELKTDVCADKNVWERKPQLENFQSELNTLGEDQWNLVSVQNIYTNDGGLFTVGYLKREKQ